METPCNPHPPIAPLEQGVQTRCTRGSAARGSAGRPLSRNDRSTPQRVRNNDFRRLNHGVVRETPEETPFDR
jgi:hypothetical protein